MEKLRHREFTHLVGGRAGAQTQETSHQRTRMRKRQCAGEGCWQGMAQVPVLFPHGGRTHGDWSGALRNSIFLLPQWVLLFLPTCRLYFFHFTTSRLWKDPPLGDGLHTHLQPHSSLASRKVEEGKEETHPGRFTRIKTLKNTHTQKNLFSSRMCNGLDEDFWWLGWLLGAECGG